MAVQAQLRGPAPKEELIALDGKEPKHGGGQSVLTAVCVPSQDHLASGIVDTKTEAKFPSRANSLKDLHSAAGWFRWMPCTRKLKPLANSCWKPGPTIC